MNMFKMVFYHTFFQFSSRLGKKWNWKIANLNEMLRETFLMNFRYKKNRWKKHHYAQNQYGSRFALENLNLMANKRRALTQWVMHHSNRIIILLGILEFRGLHLLGTL